MECMVAFIGEQEGITIGGDHLYRYWPQKDAWLRTHASLLHNAQLALSTGDAVSTSAYRQAFIIIYHMQVCGVKGPTVLALHPCFNFAFGSVINDLHGLYLGVPLTLLWHWFDETHRGRP